jgi:hypothetical protein
MAYFSVGAAPPSPAALGCGEQCGCRRARRLGEWYERDDEPPPPRARRGALGEPPPAPPPRPLPPVPRLVLTPPTLLQPPTGTPLERRLQRVFTRDLPPLRLGPPPPALRAADLLPPNLQLPPDYVRRLQEQWERDRERHEHERRQRAWFQPTPPPPPRPTLMQAIENYIDTGLNRVMSDLHVPPALRPHLRDAARGAIGRGAQELLDQALSATRLNSEVREAISNSVRAAMMQIRP